MKSNIYKDKQSLAEDFSLMLKELINSNEVTYIALSGGSTPKAIFDFITSNHQEDIRWDKVHFYWGDERCVSPMDAESNYKMTLHHLLKNINMPIANIHRIRGENKPSYEARRYAEALRHGVPMVNNIPQFDLVILGLGDDGHTASIFPHEIKLWDSRKYCVVASHPESGQKRISITGKVINNAKAVVFLVTGSNKKEKVKELILNKKGAENYPASFVKPTSRNLSWYLDKEAAEHVI